MAFRIGLTDFPSLFFHAAAGITIMTVLYVFTYRLMIIDNDNFNKGCLLVLIYKVLIGDVGFTDFPSMSFHAAAGGGIMNAFTLMLIDNVNFGVKIFSGGKGTFLFLESISFFCLEFDS